ncbi:Dihydrofolate reductase [Babesia microti strain RI]|uniref:Bifunctional dihydrofolate reductase-thymidylate synthase n=1 Tax=Babesia microti (strain RI) TaxID=1133968 RepID=A0A1R4AAV1_BABMR|nr:Dihydrofolate reductase [Babesia microti strain RI]SJK86128.1 Dihydrofolate reductase [Babesia microti strain RI]|eukprot:XP_021338322.1 Dihydrofolate reductase [Babesia microti strain RI]
MGMYKVCSIYASTPNGGIGNEGKLPWKTLPRDLKHLQDITTAYGPDHSVQNVVIMGRKTYISIPKSSRPLKDRINIVLSSSVSDFGDGVIAAKSMQDAFDKLEKMKFNKIFIIGGSSVYKEAYDLGIVEKVYVTRVNKELPADTFVTSVPPIFEIVGISRTFSYNDIPFDFIIYMLKDSRATSNVCVDIDDYLLTEHEIRDFKYQFKALPNVTIRKHEEIQYLDIIADILSSGSENDDRTGVGVLSKFGYKMEFNLDESFPLLTTKKVFFKGIVEELLWFIKGDTSGKILLEKGVRIWEKNGTREFLDSVGLNERKEHDLGPIYGFQWRHFGAEYKDCDTNYTGQGIDQLMEAIDKIKNDPNSRRIIVCSWNVNDLSKMALPPCHCLFQFYVSQGRLSCIMYQRSADVGLGVPFNIASYSLLTLMIAQVCALRPGKFVHVLGNAHIYKTHITALTKQIQRIPYPFPILKLNAQVKRIEDFVPSDINLLCYTCHPTIKMDMAA